MLMGWSGGSARTWASARGASRKRQMLRLQRLFAVGFAEAFSQIRKMDEG